SIIARGTPPLPRRAPLRPEAYSLADLGEGLLRHGPGLARPVAKNFLDPLRIVLELLLTLTDRLQVGDDVVGQRAFAIDAADGCRRAPRAYPLDAFRVREKRMQGVNVADVRVPRVLAPDACRISGRRRQLPADAVIVLAEGDGIANRLRHLRLSVEPQDLRGTRQQRLWFWEIFTPASIEAPHDLAG